MVEVENDGIGFTAIHTALGDEDAEQPDLPFSPVGDVVFSDDLFMVLTVSVIVRPAP